ncbi:MAG: HAD family phosphatase [Brevinematales bacterium]|nr:HAD family phosphatase [Brevinematales bacterium]
MIRGVIFDMDGLMIDSERLYFDVQREIAAEYGKTVRDSTLWKMMGRKSDAASEIFIDEVGLPITAMEFQTRVYDMMDARIRVDLQPMPGLFNILKELHHKYKMAIATGSIGTFMRHVVDALDIRGYFDILQPSDDIANGKPDPEIYLTVCAKMGLTPAECVVLEDSSNGARAGKNAGCFTIAVPNDHTRGQDFSFADAVVSDLHGALGIINKRAGL